MSNEKMVEKYQCPGCVCGSDTNCGSFKPDSSHGSTTCGSHVLGTFMMPGGHAALGLPKGFNRPGPNNDDTATRSKIRLRMYERPEDVREWDHLNVPVWAMEQGGDLFVRTFCPRIGNHFVDVIAGGTMKMAPGAIDVAKFINDID